jgi:hypothetical protein
MKRTTFSFHGVNVLVKSESSDLVRHAEHDFSYFKSPQNKYHLQITYHKQKPDYDQLPLMISHISTPRNISFQGEGVTYIDYFGKALNVYNQKESACDIFAEDSNLAHEITYLTILSRVSELLDKQRLHRIHALGLEHMNRGFLIVLPAGGGKTTLAMSVLQSANKNIRLISEDSPLVRSDGTLLPFPLRIGVVPQKLPSGIDAQFTRLIKRMEFSSKVTIDIRLFADKICSDPVRPSVILLGERSTGAISKICRTSKFSIMKHFLMNSVIGVGLYQGMEFIMQKSLLGLLGHSRITLSRLHNNLNLIFRSKIYTFTLGRDITENYKTLERFIEESSINIKTFKA